MIPFGPQLIGQTEKALNAVLRSILADHRLTEAHWVTLRLTSQFDGAGSLSDFIGDRAQFSNASALLSWLTQRGLVTGDQLTDAGNATVAAIGRRIAELTEPVWAMLNTDDTAAAERLLNVVLERTRAIVSTNVRPHFR
jgi:hypothetical protein